MMENLETLATLSTQDRTKSNQTIDHLTYECLTHNIEEKLQESTKNCPIPKILISFWITLYLIEYLQSSNGIIILYDVTRDVRTLNHN